VKNKLRRASAFTNRVGLQGVQRLKNSLGSSKFPKLKRDNVSTRAAKLIVVEFVETEQRSRPLRV
jgi:hypothetical protein